MGTIVAGTTFGFHVKTRQDEMMKKSLLALPGAGIATLLAGGFAGKRKIAEWAENPDPLNGAPVQFPDAERRTVPLGDGTEIAVWIVGAGPTIVLVHGLTASHHDWGPIAPLLVDAGYRVVAIDQRGHGESTAGTAGYGSAQLGTDLADVFNALDLHVLALVGHSMGAMASMGFAAGHPKLFNERVSSFVSVTSSGATDAVRQSLGLRLGAIKLPERLTQIQAERLRLLTGLSVFGKDPSLHMIDEAIAAVRKCPEDVRAPATLALKEHDVLEALQQMKVPALIIGAGRDQLVRPEQIVDLHAAIPNSEMHMYPDAGHMVLWEEYEDVAERIVQFVQSVGQQAVQTTT